MTRIVIHSILFVRSDIMKIGIITDSASNLDLAFIEKHDNLIMTPLMISYDGEFHRDIIEVDYETVYSKLKTTKVTTSLPSLGDFQEAIEKANGDIAEAILSLSQ